MAKALDENTMNCSRLTARMAGIESTANTTSDDSTTISTASSGVASRLPFWTVNRFWPSYSVVDGIDPVHQLEDGVVVGVDLLVAGPEQLDRGVEQERAEDVDDPAEPLEDGDAAEDEDGPQHQRAEDAPEQDPELVLLRHREVAHDQRPHEDVVDAERLLDEVAGVVLAGRGAALPGQDHEAEQQADGDPHRRLDGRFPGGDDVGGPVDEQQVDQQQRGDQGGERGPDPQRDVEVDELAGGGRSRRQERDASAGIYRSVTAEPGSPAGSLPTSDSSVTVRNMLGRHW